MRWLAAWLVGIAAIAAVASGAPQVDIKAKTQLSLGSVRLVGDTEVEVTGSLVDKLTGEAISNQQVSVTVGNFGAIGFTGPDGKFRATLPIEGPGTTTVTLKFIGLGPFDSAGPVRVVTDPSRAQVVLSVRAEAGAGGANVIVTASVDDSPTTLPVKLAVGAPSDPELRPLQTIESGTPFLVTRAAAGGPGTRKIRATYDGDDTRQPATAETTIELSSATTTLMKVNTLDLAFEDELVVTGKVTDEDGKPVSRAAVTLTAGDKRLAGGATNDSGNYKFEVEAEILGQGQFGIVVQSDPPVTYMRPSKSEPAIIRVAAPQPVPISYTIAAFVATALAAGGFFAARNKPWRRFRRPAPPAEAPEKTGEDTDSAVGGLVAAKPGIVSTLRRPYDDGFSGAVRDTVRGRFVAEAVVSLSLGDVERDQRTNADGSFAIERLDPGDWRAEVAAPGHITERFIVTIPHRGELRGVRVDLVPVRERVFQLYRRAAEPVLPESRLWGIWSPRQIVDHVRSKRPSPALLELTDFVEEVYFSARLASEEVIPQASERVDQAIRERTRVPA